MTTLGICFEWLVVFIEFTLGHYFMNIFFEKQFSGKKQRVVFFVIISVTTTGIILLNLIDISFSIVTVLFAVLSIAIGSCVLYQGSFIDFLIVSLSFITGMNLLEWFYLDAIALIWSPAVVRAMESGFSILRILALALIKGIEIVLSLVIAGPFLKKLVLRVEKTKAALLASAAAFLSSTWFICNLGTGFKSEFNPVQLVLMILIIFLLCFGYLCYCLNRIRNEQRFTARQNYFSLEKQKKEQDIHGCHSSRTLRFSGRMRRCFQNAAADSSVRAGGNRRKRFRRICPFRNYNTGPFRNRD
ncbi:MAG TPA: hypothetical protein H9700_04460 [Candidatus Eisenbergiella intestinipullorum]|nr:hypothetical protein [Candidatus Eisenbergiella intestinipullorum]